jgi:hypothetical protein
MPAQVLEHSYTYESFGSWWSIVRFKGIPYRIVLDGRDRELVVERSFSPRPPYDWSVIHSVRLDGAAPDDFGQRVVEILRVVGVAG